MLILFLGRRPWPRLDSVVWSGGRAEGGIDCDDCYLQNHGLLGLPPRSWDMVRSDLSSTLRPNDDSSLDGSRHLAGRNHEGKVPRSNHNCKLSVAWAPECCAPWRLGSIDGGTQSISYTALHRQDIFPDTGPVGHTSQRLCQVGIGNAGFSAHGFGIPSVSRTPG